jgi:hypothetical protein
VISLFWISSMSDLKSLKYVLVMNSLYLNRSDNEFYVPKKFWIGLFHWNSLKYVLVQFFWRKPWSTLNTNQAYAKTSGDFTKNVQLLQWSIHINTHIYRPVYMSVNMDGFSLRKGGHSSWASSEWIIKAWTTTTTGIGLCSGKDRWDGSWKGYG